MAVFSATADCFVTRVPEVRDTKNGQIVKVGVGIDKGFGESKRVVWAEVVAFAGAPVFTFLSEHVKKGDRLTVAGVLDLREFQGKNGPDKALELHAFEVNRHPRAAQVQESDEATDKPTAPAEQPAPPQRQAAPAGRPAAQQRQTVPPNRQTPPPQRSGGPARLPVRTPATAPANSPEDSSDTPFDSPQF